MDAYGVGVRAGALTPQIDDERKFRASLDLPDLSEDVEDVWADEPTRRPITLAQTGMPAKEEAPSDGEEDQ